MRWQAPCDRRHHPAVLVAMIMNAADLAHVPADCEHFEQLAFIDQVPGVVALRVEKIGRKSFRANRFLSGKFHHARNREILLGNGAELFCPFVDCQLFHHYLFHGVHLQRAQRTIPNISLYLSAFRAVDKNREYARAIIKI